jgi:DNA repair exonuclease SbcCD ATPase subunit
MENAVRFEGLNRKLRALESMDVVGADDIFESISLLLSDIYALRGNGSIDTFGVKHEDIYVTALLKTINTAMLSYEKNASSLNGMSERRRKSYDTAVARIQAADKELAPLVPKIEELSKAEKELEAKLSELRELKETATRLSESIQGLEDEISRLDSISIEELQKKETKLIQEKKEKQERFDAVKSSIEIIGGEIEELKKRIAEKSDVQNRNLAEKERLETEDKKLTQELSDYLNWKDVFIEEQNKRLGQMAEARNQLTTIQNAWSVICQRQELPEILKETGEFKINNPANQNFDDIKKWFDDMQTGIGACIDSYTEAYHSLLSALKPNNE